MLPVVVILSLCSLLAIYNSCDAFTLSKSVFTAAGCISLSLSPLHSRYNHRILCATDNLGPSESVLDSVPDETEAEKYKREKLAEINELKAKEVFVTRTTGKFECQACGYIYDETKGLPKKGIVAGTPFDEIDKFRCPQCGANKKYFVPEQETISGFKENLKYGLGTNSLTSGQKSLLIFGGLALGFAVFMSGYLLE
jgi:rubredoxin